MYIHFPLFSLENDKAASSDCPPTAAECVESQEDEGTEERETCTQPEAAEENDNPNLSKTDDDRHQTDVDAVTGQVTTVPEPQPRSRPTTEAEREQMCLTLCDLASPITCEISELDEQENILVRQNSLRPVFLQYFKTTIYHR